MYRRVILPTDGSGIAKKGVMEGLKFAKKLDIPAYSIYVLDIDRYDEFEESKVRSDVKDSMKKTAERALRWVRKRAQDEGADINTEILVGEPYERIVEEADKKDVIYMSSHGASGFKEAIFGSTTERVLKHAECTVIVAKER